MSKHLKKQPGQPEKNGDSTVRHPVNFAELSLAQLLAIDGQAMALINDDYEILYLNDPAGLFPDIHAAGNDRDMPVIAPASLRTRLRAACEAALQQNQPVRDNDCLPHPTDIIPVRIPGRSGLLLLLIVRQDMSVLPATRVQEVNLRAGIAEQGQNDQETICRVQQGNWQQQNCRLQMMVEELPAGAVYREKDRLTMNRATEELTGYQRGELDDVDTWFEKLHGGNVNEVRRIYEEARAAGFPRKSEPISIIRKDGEERLVEFSAYKFKDHEVWLMHDATKSLQHEAALHEREKRLQAIMDHVAEAIIVYDSKGLVTDFNPASEALFGYALDEVIGNNISMLMQSPVDTGENFTINQPRELAGRRRDGSIVPLMVTVTPIEPDNLFCGIMRDLTEQKSFEKEIADISTQEQERIGQEIHDGLGQQLTGLIMMATSLQRDLARQKLPQADRLDDIIEQLNLATSDARRLSHGLSPVPLDQQGLNDALRILADNIRAATGIDCVFESLHPVDVRDRTNAMQLYRIAQEAVNNAVKHAKARNIGIRLSGGSNIPCELTIRDDGGGFQVDETSKQGLGLRIMRYRAGIIGCRLDIETAPNKGTVIRCTSTTISN